MTIQPGMAVKARTADGKTLNRIAATRVVDGADFPVVWIASEEDWLDAQKDGRRCDALPWPAEDVWPADEVPA